MMKEGGLHIAKWKKFFYEIVYFTLICLFSSLKFLQLNVFGMYTKNCKQILGLYTKYNSDEILLRWHENCEINKI